MQIFLYKIQNRFFWQIDKYELLFLNKDCKSQQNYRGTKIFYYVSGSDDWCRFFLFLSIFFMAKIKIC